MNVQAESATMPAWWTFQPMDGACRANVASFVFNFSTFANINGACTDPFRSISAGGIADYRIIVGANARIRGVDAIESDSARALLPGQEYYGFRFVFNNSKTTGAGSCTGCSTPVAIVLCSLRAVGRATGSEETCTTAAQSQHIGWQSAAPATCFTTPTQNRTWGQVKSPYR
jgi:hypothetical protein